MRRNAAPRIAETRACHEHRAHARTLAAISRAARLLPLLLPMRRRRERGGIITRTTVAHCDAARVVNSE